MKITIEILGLPVLAQAVGMREIELNLPGEETTVQQALDYLVERFGPPVRQALYDEQGSLNPIIQIALNGRYFVALERLDTAIKDGDALTFMLLMAGG